MWESVSVFPRDFLMVTVNTFVISHLLCRSNESWVQSHKNRMFKFFTSFFQTRWTYTSNTFKYNPRLKIWTLDCYVMCLHIYIYIYATSKPPRNRHITRGPFVAPTRPRSRMGSRKPRSLPGGNIHVHIWRKVLKRVPKACFLSCLQKCRWGKLPCPSNTASASTLWIGSLPNDLVMVMVKHTVPKSFL